MAPAVFSLVDRYPTMNLVTEIASTDKPPAPTVFENTTSAQEKEVRKSIRHILITSATDC